MQYLKLNRLAGIVIYGVGVAILTVNLVYLLGSNRTEVVDRSNLFPPLDKLTVSEFVSDTFPMAESQDHEDFRGYDRYVIFGRQDDPIGYVYEIQEDLRCPVCNNVRLLVALDSADEIREIQALEPLELSGEPLPVEDETRFFAQFKSDLSVTSFVLGENVDGITGATKSSIHIVDSINKLLITHRG